MTHDIETVKAKLLDALEEVNAVIDGHLSQLSDDDQYDYPELRWVYSVRSWIEKSLKELECPSTS